jgi:hypothetical protein
MRVFFAAMVLGAFLLGCSVPPGQVKKQSAAGQVQKKTGVNPASGKKK